MIRKTMQIGLASGPNARPAAMLVQIASEYESIIRIEIASGTINAKSIMGMMTLGLDTGSEITVTAEGSDEAEAIAAIANYLAGGR